MGVIRAVVESAGVILAAFGLSALVTALGVAIGLRRFRRSAGRDWPERAAATYPARQSVRNGWILHAIGLGGVAYLRVTPAPGVRPQTLAALVALAGVVGALAVGQWLECRICREAGDGGPARRRGIALSWIMGFPTLVSLSLTMAIVPQRWGWLAAATIALGALLTTCELAGLWLVPLRWAGLLRPASPRALASVERTSAWAGVRPREVLDLASPNANAIVWWLPRVLIFCGPIVDELDDDELDGVVAHELGHLTEPPAIAASRLTAPFALTVLPAGIPFAGSFGPLFFLLPPAVVLVVVLVMQRVGRRMEERADRFARDRGEAAGVVYARALEKLYEANLAPVVSRAKRQVHPQLYDRLVAAGATPSYPRPVPPRTMVAATLPTFLLLFWCFWTMLPPAESGVDPDDEFLPPGAGAARVDFLTHD